MRQENEYGVRPLRAVLLLFLLIPFCLLTTGCNREKAEALKVAAERFRIDAIAALDAIATLLTESVRMPRESPEAEIARLSRDLEGADTVNAEALSLLVEEQQIGAAAVETVRKEMDRIGQSYYQFEAMFRSLPQGSLLGRDAVRRAERHAIRLTLEMVNFASTMKEHPVRFTGRRTILLERITEAKKIQDQERRRDRMAAVARDILALRHDEERAREEAILRCLRAAESGRLVANLIRDYDSLSVEELLVSLRTSMGFVAEISGGKGGVPQLVEKYKAIETAIREDPYWSAVLSEKIVK